MRILLLLLLVGCGGGDPEPVEPTEAEVVVPPPNVCGPERIHCL
jgi:hypothetical protein